MLCIGAGGLGSPALALPRGGGRRHARPRRLRRRSTSATCSGRFCYSTQRRRPAASSRRRRAGCRRSTRTCSIVTHETRADVRERARHLPAATTSSSTAPTTSRRAIWSTTRACCSASRTPTAASSGSTGRRRCSRPRADPCYRCLYPEPPPPGLVPSCAEGGVLGVLPGIIGTIQATEAIKLILGIGDHARRPAAAAATRWRMSSGR